jgi:hypothetical protein
LNRDEVKQEIETNESALLPRIMRSLEPRGGGTVDGVDRFGSVLSDPTEAIEQFKAKKLSPVELMRALLARCDAVNEKLNVLTYTFAERALEQAKAAEARYMKGDARPLEGVPVAIKDFHPVKDEITTFGSLVYRNFRPDNTAPTVERLFEAGAIMHCRPPRRSSMHCRPPRRSSMHCRPPRRSSLTPA